MRRRAAALLAALLPAGGCADRPAAPGICVMRELAVLPVLNDRRQPIIRAVVNGVPVAFIVDTGARVSTVFEPAAALLGLPTGFGNRHVLVGTGGAVFARDVTIRSLQLDHLVARDVQLVSAGHLREQVGGLPLAGLFGGDFLANYDVLFDLPARRLSLYRGRGCGDRLRPWPDGAFYRLAFSLVNDTEIDLPIAINGHEVPAVLDSGAGRTVLDRAAGRKGGATDATMANDPVTIGTGIDGNRNPIRLHRFDSLQVGPERLAPALVEVGDTGVTLLGADYLRGRRVWISYPHQVIYVQPVPGRRAGTS